MHENSCSLTIANPVCYYLSDLCQYRLKKNLSVVLFNIFFILRVRFSVFSYVQEPNFFFSSANSSELFKIYLLVFYLLLQKVLYFSNLSRLEYVCVLFLPFFFFVFWLHHVETCVLHILNYQFISLGNFLVVQWLGLCASNTGGMSSVPGWEAKIPHASPSAPFPPKFISLFFYDFWILYQTQNILFYMKILPPWHFTRYFYV